MLRTLAFCLTLMLSVLVMAPQGYAQPAPTTSNDEVCTSFSARAAQMGNATATGGMLSDIHKFMTGIVNNATQKIFTSFTSSSSYTGALYAAITLMIIFYAVGFTMGVVQPSFQQVLVRLIKIGILFTLISPTGWQFFNDNVVTFFQDGSDDLIKGVQAIGTGITAPTGATPFYALDRLAEFLIQPDTLIAMMGALFAGGPFGLTMSALLILAMYGFFQLILKTLQIYATTFVARALILGVAPIFFTFLLFERTKNMFVSWLNALINLSLQPILMFTFLSFFLVLIETASKDMLSNELCWREYKSIDGSVNKMAFWRYVDDKTNTTNTSEMTWQGSLECLLSPNGGAGKCAEFPINIVDLLSFLILVYIAQRFTQVVERISSELSNAVVALDTQGKIEQMLQQKGGGGGFSLPNPAAGGQRKPK